MIEKYQKRESKYNKLSNNVSKVVSLVISMKFIVVILAIIQAIVFYKYEQYILGVALLIVFIAGYLYIDKKHDSLLDCKNTATILANINLNAVKRFDGQWRNFEDNGDDLNETDHSYSSDLDIIGKDSLFQWINMSATPWGRKSLAKELLSTGCMASSSGQSSDNTPEIVSKQESIAELSKKINFRHRLKAEGIKLNANEEEFKELVEWAQTTQALFLKTWVIAAIRSLPILTITLFLLGPILKIIPTVIPVLILLFNAILLFVGNRKLRTQFESVHKCKRSLQKLEGVFVVIEKHKFKTPLLIGLKKKLLNEQKLLPSKQIKNLSIIASNISNRNNMFYYVMSLFLLSDFQYYISLEKWKNKSGKYLGNWFDVIGNFEALSSTSLIKYNNPTWATPLIEHSSASTIVKAVQVGHPLIGHGCILNDIHFTNDHSITLITGSNMSGKSTFLRTIGINLILAYIGAPVCAKEFSCQYLSLFTCMRVADDLQKNISSFYCEILRVKMIIDQAKNRKKVFFLLDEIFKGTNSVDRHTAAKAIIHNLSKYGASGMVSTHDLELEVLENESNGTVSNYHFEENYNEDKISFDYKLRRGVSTTRNAIFLIKASGIDM